MRLLLALAVTVFIGWNILYLVFAGRRPLGLIESACVSYGLGVGFISLEMLLFYFLKAPFNLFCILAPWPAFVVVNLYIYLNRKAPPEAPRGARSGKFGPLAAFLALGIGFEVAYAFFRALIKPIESYDAIAIYAIKAKILYMAKAFPADFFYSLVRPLAHPDYPLNIPLFETFIYLFLGNLNDQLVKIIFPLYFVAVLAVFYFAVRRFATRRYALLFTFILAGVGQFNAFATNAYLDLPLGFYCFASAVFLFLWFEDTKRTGFLLLSAVMAGLAGWTKNEGLMYCAINMVLLGLFIIFDRKKVSGKGLMRFALYALAISAVVLPWAYVKKSAHIANSEIDLANINPFNLARQSRKIWPILYEFQKEFFNFKKWNILWPAAFTVLIFKFKEAFGPVQRYISLSIMLAVAGYALFYMISYVDAAFFTGKTWSRFLIHFLPIAVYWLARILKEDIPL